MADLEHPSLLPAVLLGEPEVRGRRGRSARDWLVDVAIFAAVILLAGPLFLHSLSQDPAPALVAADLAAGGVGLLGLWVRRRWPVALALVLMALGTFSVLASIMGAAALFTVAVHRPFRTVAAVAVVSLATIPIFYLLRPEQDDSFLTSVIVGTLVTVACVAWGMFVRARRQLVLSLRERARRAESEQSLRVEQARRMERDRIAREMHDVLAHRISLVSLHAGALEYAPGASPEEVARAAGVIRSAAHQALEDLREVIGVLRDGGDVDGAPERPQPTLADLDALLEESRAAGMRVSSHDGSAEPGAVPTSIGRSAYRVVQEGLTNARKHAPGCTVDVAVAGQAGQGLTVEVRNPMPVGSATAEIPGAGTGIIGLGERVALAGGRLEHGASDGEWRLRAWLPWPAA
jgi:signal transduction histidine kinase